MIRDKKFAVLPFWIYSTSVLSQSRPWLGAVGLFLAFGLGCMMRFHGTFVDEGDNLAVGHLLQEGHVLYRTLFSHHFPFPYYWLAAAFALLGPTVESARLSLLLFQLLAFGLTMYTSRLYLAIGLLAVTWNSVALFSFGNMAIYQSFSAITLVPIFVLTFITIHWQRPLDGKSQLTFALFATIGLLTNPLLVFPIALSLLFLFLARRYKEASAIIAMMSFGGGLYLSYLILTDSLLDFYNSAILFNSQIYAQYSSTVNGNYLDVVLGAAAHVLHLFNPEKAMFPIDMLASYDAASQWLLSGTASKVVLILFSLMLASRKRFLPAAFVYLFAATLLTRGRTNFDQLALVLVAICSLSLLAAGIGSASDGEVQQKRAVWGQWVAGGLLVWMVGCGLYYPIAYPERMTYEANFGYYESWGDRIVTRSCGQADRLGVYPGNPYLYFFADIQPISKYPFMWPWVADIGLGEEVKGLKTQQMAIVYFDSAGSVWGKPNTEFLQPLSTYLAQHYIPVGEDLYLSPALHQSCQALSAQEP
ncbi:MAG: hypothetical protein H0T73_07370 [Ardenticatenales bacterium]|nr:hypothetical protein [Ardenticatenales bacterium]